MLRTLVLLMLAWAGFCSGKSPHILFVVMDDLGSHDLGIHGTGIHTPTCDQLIRDGVFLSEYYVLPACSPTRAALMSGRYPLHTGVNNIIDADSTIGLPLDEELIPNVLARAGYQRFMVGKWHIGNSQWEQTPTFRGFESFYGYLNGMEDYYSHDFRGAYDFRHDSREFCGKSCSQPINEIGNYSTHLFSRAAVDVIEKYDEKHGPLFLYLAFQAVHAPDEVPASYEQPYANKNWTKMRKTYAGMLSCADEAIENVTQALKARGLWQDTLVAFTTDNGGPTEVCTVQGSSNWPLRGGKCSVWEGGTRGDGFLSGPALSKLAVTPGTKLPHMFHVTDWLPTLAAIVGVAPAGKPLDGVNQLGALRGGAAAREEVYIGLFGPFGPGVRKGKWKIVRGGGGPSAVRDGEEVAAGGAGGWVTNRSELLLFDLSSDAGEAHNLAAERPEELAAMKAVLERYEASGVPQQRENPRCKFSPDDWIVVEGIGPVWAPWCSASDHVILYR